VRPVKMSVAQNLDARDGKKIKSEDIEQSSEFKDFESIFRHSTKHLPQAVSNRVWGRIKRGYKNIDREPGQTDQAPKDTRQYILYQEELEAIRKKYGVSAPDINPTVITPIRPK